VPDSFHAERNVKAQFSVRAAAAGGRDYGEIQKMSNANKPICDHRDDMINGNYDDEFLSAAAVAPYTQRDAPREAPVFRQHPPLPVCPAQVGTSPRR
jgi:hypothetical protein